jgi:hypothetical protein
MVFLKQPITQQIVTVKVKDEVDFQEKINRFKSKLISRFNKVQNTNYDSRFYKVYDEDEDIREIENTMDIYLSQSILFEDKFEIIKQIKQACSLNKVIGDDSFEIEYWGQSERTRSGIKAYDSHLINFKRITKYLLVFKDHILGTVFLCCK